MQHYNSIFIWKTFVDPIEAQTSSHSRLCFILLFLQMCVSAGRNFFSLGPQISRWQFCVSQELSSGVFCVTISTMHDSRFRCVVYCMCCVLFPVGWCLAMHGGNGRFSRQVLSCSLRWRSANSWECSEENRCWCMCQLYVRLRLFLLLDEQKTSKHLGVIDVV